MNIYQELNKCINYIEEHIRDTIDYKYISRMLGCSESTMQRVFSLITGVSLSEYIRRRRLTLAVADLQNKERIIDVAIKYGYASETSFSRSFKKMHGVLPSKIRNNNIHLNLQPILKFHVNNINSSLSYRIEELKKFTLYGIKKEVDIHNVPKTAEKLWDEAKKKYKEFNEEASYGITTNINGIYYYFCALEIPIDGLEKITIPLSKYMVLKNKDKKGANIKKLFEAAYDLYMPSVGLKSSQSFEIEKYSKDGVELYVMIN